MRKRESKLSKGEGRLTPQDHCGACMWKRKAVLNLMERSPHLWKLHCQRNACKYRTKENTHWPNPQSGKAPTLLFERFCYERYLPLVTKLLLKGEINYPMTLWKDAKTQALLLSGRGYTCFLVCVVRVVSLSLSFCKLKGEETLCFPALLSILGPGVPACM